MLEHMEWKVWNHGDALLKTSFYKFAWHQTRHSWSRACQRTDGQSPFIETIVSKVGTNKCDRRRLVKLGGLSSDNIMDIHAFIR
jgi:hypothetical protein